VTASRPQVLSAGVRELDLGPNAVRFTGFADLYDRVRPTPPADAAELIRSYAGGRADTVVDLGCGTGLSIRWAAGWGGHVIGVEPSADMRDIAAAALPPNAELRAGWSHDSGLGAGSADVVLAVQALHWMDPEPTFAEVARITRPGGVFVAMDCDWPPSVGNAQVELAWKTTRAREKAYEERLAAGLRGDGLTAPLESVTPLPVDFGRDPNKNRTMAVGVRSWSKDEHLGRMRASGRFRDCFELCMHTREQGSAKRFVDLLRSQGDHQTLLKHGVTEAQLGAEDFEATAIRLLGTGDHPMVFTYRLRFGIV
jgi:SAM-dependent methyltransferase